MDKPTLVIINNYIWSVDNIDVRMKYELLSERYNGLMLYLCSGKHEHVYGNFRCLSSPYSNPVKRMLTYPLFCLRMARTLGHVDAIICYDPLIPGIVGYLLKLVTGARLIVEVNTHNVLAMRLKGASLLSRLKNYFVPLVIRIVLKRADAIKFVSATLRDDVTKAIDLSRQHLANFNDFVPSSVFANTPSENSCYILTVGFPYQIKGVDVLIRAFNLITDEFPEVRLKVIGSCNDFSPYKELTDDNHAIEFHTGMPYAELIPHFERCLFFVLASRTEGLPRVLIEAMASGKALIGSNVGGIPELIEDGVNGLLFESENHEMLADRMRTLLRDERLMRQMGEASYRKAQENYTPKRYMDLYHELIIEVTGCLNVQPAFLNHD